MAITITYTSIDRCRKQRTFKTLKGARRFAEEMVGPQDTVGGSYAVSDDGVGKVTWQGCTRAELFGNPERAATDAEYHEAERAHAAMLKEAELAMAREYEDGISDYQRACEDGSLLEWERTNGDW